MAKSYTSYLPASQTTNFYETEARAGITVPSLSTSGYVITAQVSLPRGRYLGTQVMAFTEELTARAETKTPTNRAMRCMRELLVNDLRETFVGLSSGNQSSVDEECWCSGHSEPACFLDVSIYTRPVFVGGDALLECSNVHAYFSGKARQLFGACVGPAGIEFVMEFPELSLVVGTARRLSRLACAWVEPVEREVPIGKANPVAVFRKNSREGGLNLLAVGTMEIRELDDRYRRIRRAANWSAPGAHIGTIDRGRFQINDDVRLSSKRLDKGLLHGATPLVLELRLNGLAILIELCGEGGDLSGISRLQRRARIDSADIPKPPQ
jgi:hypothetical protein